MAKSIELKIKFTNGEVDHTIFCVAQKPPFDEIKKIIKEIDVRTIASIEFTKASQILWHWDRKSCYLGPEADTPEAKAISDLIAHMLRRRHSFNKEQVNHLLSLNEIMVQLNKYMIDDYYSSGGFNGNTGAGILLYPAEESLKALKTAFLSPQGINKTDFDTIKNMCVQQLFKAEQAYRNNKSWLPFILNTLLLLSVIGTLFAVYSFHQRAKHGDYAFFKAASNDSSRRVEKIAEQVDSLDFVENSPAEQYREEREDAASYATYG